MTKKENAQKLFRLISIEKRMEGVAGSLLERIEQRLPKQATKVAGYAKDNYHEIFLFVKKKLCDFCFDLWTKHFTNKDLNVLILYWQTETAKKVEHFAENELPKLDKFINELEEEVEALILTNHQAILPKAKIVLHHDDPPCTERLTLDGTCPVCKLVPDMQSLAIYYYCSTDDVLLKHMNCYLCQKTFKKP